jgi:F-type H+-transporting ATPase subunit a
VFLAVGLIEVFSISSARSPFRSVSSATSSAVKICSTAPAFFFVFYFMELLVGLIQATCFTLLTAVYIGLLCNHGDDHDHAHDDKHGDAPKPTTEHFPPGACQACARRKSTTKPNKTNIHP